MDRRRPAPASRSCGAGRGTGGHGETGVPGSATPATEWMRLTSAASSSASGGRSPAPARARSVLPTPGGPTKARLWRPATAISSARRPTVWPITEARSGASSRAGARGGGCRGRRDARALAPREMADDLAEAVPPDARRRRQPRRSPAPFSTGTIASVDARAARRRDERHRARDRAQRAVERQLADERDAPEVRLELAGRDEDGRGHGQVVAGPLFRQVGRSQVDGDPAGRDLEAGVAKGGAHTLARLEHRAAGEADDRQAGKPERDVDLDAHGHAVDTDDRCAERIREHGHALRGEASMMWTRGRCRPPACSPPYLPAATGAASVGNGRLPARLARDLPRPIGPQARAGTASSAKIASISRANLLTLWPSGPSGRDAMNGSPEFRALIAPRYSLMTW